jgi:hypothetical protein
MLSFITPPVALGAFAAAAIAGASALRTGFTAMRLGSVVYFIPFFFVIDPALVLKSGPTAAAVATVQALAGITLVAGALQGYLPGIGNLRSAGPVGGLIRGTIVLGGLLIATPEPKALALEASDAALALTGAVLVAAALLADRRSAGRVTSPDRSGTDGASEPTGTADRATGRGDR